MQTMPHLSQIQSTEMTEYPHLLAEMLDILSRIDKLENVSIKGIFDSYAEMVEKVTEVGFYNVVADETFFNKPTGYFFDGKNFHIEYGLDVLHGKLVSLEDIAKDTVELIKPKINEKELGCVRLKPGDTQIKIPLDKDNYLYDGGAEVNGVDVKDIFIEDKNLVINIEDAPASTPVKITLPTDSIKTPSGKGNNSINIDLIVEGEEPVIEQNKVNGQEIKTVGEQEFRFKVNYPVKPINKEVNLDLVHVNQENLVAKTYDEKTNEIVIRLLLENGRTYRIIFYNNTVVADNTPNDYLECVFKVVSVDDEPGDDSEEPDNIEWEYTFILSNAATVYDFNSDAKFPNDIPDDLEMYSDKYELYYLGYSGEDKPILVPRTGFDLKEPKNPNGGYSYYKGVISFDTGSIGDKFYKLVKKM